ncbi:sigma-70 family RNA polymerase sigma factor [Frigoriglobus tundricola]|uniref:Uncharacterized protein n=1 Tax=Frigoriglobus tundricola TaxID=2774151 RepID=A0A6M5YV47_9BACT|nr:sigma-70 family RNA polymerase sigma factor [Frigoriglobus tundricola]QJW97350.1 hypothetical protein FTUN_4923 [Frigoriglobus tundricola]
MLAPTTQFAPELYRGWLVLLARSQWGDALRGCDEPSDLVQQVLLEAHEKRGDFSGETRAAFESWLRKILANTLADKIRYRQRKKRDHRKTRSIEAALEESASRLGLCLVGSDPTPSAVAATAEQLTRLADALPLLPSDQADVIDLHHIKGLTLTETAARMGKTPGTVAGLLRRGFASLRKLLDERGGP